MFFSKSFGYALRGILFIALQEQRRAVPLDEMAEVLDVPRHFMAKIMKRLVQQNILASSKGRQGGFSLETDTLQRKLIDVYQLTDRPEELAQCVLSKGCCSEENPCRLHDKIAPLREPLVALLLHTTLGDLLHGDKDELLRSLTTPAKNEGSPLPSQSLKNPDEHQGLP